MNFNHAHENKARIAKSISESFSTPKEEKAPELQKSEQQTLTPHQHQELMKSQISSSFETQASEEEFEKGGVGSGRKKGTFVTHKNPKTGKSIKGRIHSEDEDGKYHHIRTTTGDLEYVESKHTREAGDQERESIHKKMSTSQYADGKRYDHEFEESEDSNIKKSIEDELEKGGKKAFIGEKRMFGGREYIKTAAGWKFHGKGTGAKAKEHSSSTKHAVDPETGRETTPLERKMMAVHDKPTEKTMTERIAAAAKATESDHSKSVAERYKEIVGYGDPELTHKDIVRSIKETHGGKLGEIEAHLSKHGVKKLGSKEVDAKITDEERAKYGGGKGKLEVVDSKRPGKREVAPEGTIRESGGRSYIKKDGKWKYHPKGASESTEEKKEAKSNVSDLIKRGGEIFSSIRNLGDRKKLPAKLESAGIPKVAELIKKLEDLPLRDMTRTQHVKWNKDRLKEHLDEHFAKPAGKHISDMSATEKKALADKLGVDVKGKTTAQVTKELLEKNVDKQIEEFKSRKAGSVTKDSVKLMSDDQLKSLKVKGTLNGKSGEFHSFKKDRSGKVIASFTHDGKTEGGSVSRSSSGNAISDSSVKFSEPGKSKESEKAPKKQKISLTWKPGLYSNSGPRANYRGAEIVINPIKGSDKSALYINGKKVGTSHSTSALQTEAQEFVEQKINKLSSFINKTVEVYPGKADKLIDFGSKSEMYSKHGLKKPANPGGYAEDRGFYFVVERNGVKEVLNPSFGDKLIRE